MKAVLIADEECVNPLFLLAADPEKLGILPLLVVPAGTIDESPDCWMLCVLGKASPEDDECREKTLEFMGSESRKKLFAQIRALKNAEGVQTLDAKTKKWLTYMETAYAVELAE